MTAHSGPTGNEVGESRMFAADETPDQPEQHQHQRDNAEYGVNGVGRAFVLDDDQRQDDRRCQRPVKYPRRQVPNKNRFHGVATKLRVR